MNPYEVLGLDKDATDEQIKKAYKRLSKKHHPDNGGDNEKFLELDKAYKILKDPEQRAYYDKHGKTMESGNGFEEMARNYLVSKYLESCIESGENMIYNNILDIAKKKMKADLGQLSEVMDGAKWAMIHLIKQKRRVKPKTKSVFLVHALDPEIAKLRKNLQGGVHSERMIKRAIELADDFELLNLYKKEDVVQEMLNKFAAKQKPTAFYSAS